MQSMSHNCCLVTEDLQRCVCSDDADIVARSTRIDTLVLNFRIDDKKHLVRRENVHASLACRGEVVTAVLL